MGIRQIKTCDVTGEELPDDTQAERISWAGKTYDLYLSNEGFDKISNFLGPITAEAYEVKQPTPTQSRPQSRRTARTDLEEIREWARGKGYTVADRGRIKQSIIEEYDAQK